MAIPSIYDKFIVHAKANGPSVFNADKTPLLESTERDYPWLRMLLRARSQDSLKCAAGGFKSKIKWKHRKGYGAMAPGTPAKWQRRGSLEFLSSHTKREWGSLQFIESEVDEQISGVYDSATMAQKFDDVLENYKQDLYVDIAEEIDATIKAVPNPKMEDGKSNVMRSIFMGMNEWKQGHGVRADGCFPGITQIQNYDPLTPGAKMAATVQRYTSVGKSQGAVKGHIFEAFMRGLREVNFMSVPLAENYTEGTMGHLECFASIEGISLIDRVHAEHDNVVAEEGINNVYTLSPRVKGVMLTDCNDLENLAICPSYDVNGEATPTANGLYVPGAQEQSYFTELTSPGARGPRFYLPYQKHIRPVWEGNGYMRTSDIYALKESVTDAKVMWVENKRNLHFEAFRRNLVIAPGTDIPGFTG